MNILSENNAYAKYTTLFDGIAIDFETDNCSEDTILPVLQLVEESYFYSAIELLDKLEKCLIEKKLNYIHRYFAPALFLSRHFIELRIKFLIARYGAIPKKSHDLKNLNEQYRQAVKEYSIRTSTRLQPFNFESVIKKINDIEKINNKIVPECYRYLYEKSNEIKSHIEIHLKDIREIRNTLQEIMFRTAMISQQDFLNEILNKSKD